MPLDIFAKLQIKNNATLPIADATQIKGSWLSVADVTARNNINAATRVSGMRVHTVSDGKTYVLLSDLTTWTEDAGLSAVQKDNSAIATQPILNFIGTGVSVADDAGSKRLNVTVPGIEILDESISLTPQPAKINFIGGGVTATYNGGANRVDVTIPGKVTIRQSGTLIQSVQTLNFIGSIVTAQYDSYNEAINLIFTETPGGGGGGGAGTLVIQSSGVPTGAPRPKLNFISSAMVVVDDPGNDRVNVTLALTADPEVISPAFVITLASASSLLVEAKNTLINPSFTSNRNYLAETAALTNSFTAENKVVLTEFNGGTTPPVGALTSTTSAAFASSQTFSGGAGVGVPGDTLAFTLTATRPGGVIIRTALQTFTWTQKVYIGVGAAGQTTAGFITGTLTGTLKTTKNGTYNATAGASQKIYFAYRTAYGASTFTVGGFAGGFNLVSTTISVTNAYGYVENFTLYESTNLNLGATTIVVT